MMFSLHVRSALPGATAAPFLRADATAAL